MNEFPSFLTGIGIVVANQVSPPTNSIGSNWDKTAIVESFSLTEGYSTCPENLFAKRCVAGQPFVVGQPGGIEFPKEVLDFDALDNIFYDKHISTNAHSALSTPGAPGQCTVVCYQTYSCGKTAIGKFKIVKQYNLGVINGTPVTNVTVTKTSTQ